MSPMPYDPNTTSPIDRQELRALLRRVRDNEAQLSSSEEHPRRVDDVVVHRAAVAAWIGRTEAIAS